MFFKLTKLNLPFLLTDEKPSKTNRQTTHKQIINKIIYTKKSSKKRNYEQVIRQEHFPFGHETRKADAFLEADFLCPIFDSIKKRNLSFGITFRARRFVFCTPFHYICRKKERMDSMKQRRTIRKYQQKDIPADLLNDLLETACRASTVGNMQTYSVIITRDAARKAKLAPAHFNQPMVQKAPVVLTFCIDLRRFSKWCKQRNAEPGYNNLEWFVTGSVDALLMAQTFCVAAEEKGLGICYLGTTTYNPQMIINALELPELVFPITTITVGWPDELPAQVDRLPLEAIVHEEVYQDYTPEDIDRLYAYKESLPENQQYVLENKKETLAQVFTDVRYTKKDSEAMSEHLWETIKKQGF